MLQCSEVSFVTGQSLISNWSWHFFSEMAARLGRQRFKSTRDIRISEERLRFSTCPGLYFDCQTRFFKRVLVLLACKYPIVILTRSLSRRLIYFMFKEKTKCLTIPYE